MAESEEELKNLFMKVKEDREKAGLKLNIYMEFRKMLMITLHAEQKKKKRHRFIEQCFRLCGRRQGWDVSREQHRNMYSI